MKTFKGFVIKEDATSTALKKKAEKSGMPVGILRKVYNRGVAAWRTGHRPGGAGAAGPLANGVDVKHGSYARYLARKKGLETRSKKATPLPAPLQGNKNYLLGLIPGCGC